MRAWTLFACVVLGWALALPVEAQLGRGDDFRFSIDADVLSMAGIEINPEGLVPARDVTVYGVGPNQIGGARASSIGTDAPTPLGLGFGWVLSPKIVLGMRLGLGLDVIDSGGNDNARILGLSLMPGLTFVPVGRHAKLFLSVSPIFQVSRYKLDTREARTLLGGFGLGIGALIFAGNSLSVDLGFHFEGRFGGYEDDNNIESDVRDLRGVVRLGLSLWK